MNHLTLPPLTRAAGRVRLPGSKSISNRMLLLAALAEGRSEVRDLLDSDDTKIMLDALRTLGATLTSVGVDAWRIEGWGGAPPVKEAELFMGNAGTAIRPLTAVLALAGGHYHLRGVPRMHERPIKDLVDGLRQIGGDVRYAGSEGYPPLDIFPAPVKLQAPIRLRGDVSSQFLTALLVALPLTGRTAVIELTTELISKPYIEITLKLMARFGVIVERSGWQRFVIAGGQRYRSPGGLHVEGDASAASYFLAAGAVGGGPVRVEGVGRASIQGDVRFAEMLARLGARIEWGENHIIASAPAGRLHAFDLDLNHIPDAAMTLAVVALFCDGPSRLRNIASWRVKETDRIAAMACELRKLGATVEEGEDWLRITPPPPRAVPTGLTFAPALVEGVTIDTYDDHRMAMCFSLAALAGVAVRINDPACVTKTFPDYFDRYAMLTAPVIAIDGPSASGKGTVAARVAQALGFHFLDSGALYRLLALWALRQQVALDDEARLATLAANLPSEFAGPSIRLAGEEVTDAIRTEEVGIAASHIAALPAVRAALLDRQRAFRRFPGLVADGRDMGSVVFADAPVKVFLTASVEARAERRHNQLIEKGQSANIPDLLQDLSERDARDAQRAVAPLQPCSDALLLDTTAMSIEEVVRRVLDFVGQRLPARTGLA